MHIIENDRIRIIGIFEADMSKYYVAARICVYWNTIEALCK